MAKKQISGFTTKSSSNMQFGAGALILNLTNPKDFVFPEDGAMTGGARILGATEGGSSFEEEIEMIDIFEGMDGYSTQAKEGQKIKSRTGTLKVTVKELSKENFQLALAAADITAASSSEKRDLIKPRLDLLPSDFQNNICLLAPKLGTDEPIIIELKNVLNTNGCKVTVADDSAGSLELELKGFSILGTDEVPYSIYIPKVTQVANL